MDRIERWFAMPVSVQLANVGGEVNRALRWKNRRDREKSLSFYRKALELLALTKQDPKNSHRLGELSFCEEELTDFFEGENIYSTTDELLTRYYDAFLK